jgi:hypothetical protein
MRGSSQKAVGLPDGERGGERLIGRVPDDIARHHHGSVEGPIRAAPKAIAAGPLTAARLTILTDQLVEVGRSTLDVNRMGRRTGWDGAR